MSVIRNLLSKIWKKNSRFQNELNYRLEQGMKLGQNCHLYSVEGIDGGWPWLITIGDDVTISTNVTILAHDASTNVVKAGTKLGRVTIGNNVFIGTGATILCNTRIGSNVVIGAGSVVTHDLPDNGVYAGVPARRICSIEEYRGRIFALRQKRPDFGKVHPWNKWKDALAEEKQQMLDGLVDGVGFV